MTMPTNREPTLGASDPKPSGQVPGHREVMLEPRQDGREQGAQLGIGHAGKEDLLYRVNHPVVETDFMSR